MEDVKKENVLKVGITYTIGNLLIKGISFITIPVFARLLSASDYGVVNTFNAYASVLFIIQGLALHSSLKNAKIDYKCQINEYISSLLIMVISLSAALLCVTFLFKEQLSKLLALPNSMMVPLLVLEGFSMVILTYYNNVLSLEYRSKEYLRVSFFYSLFSVLISLFFIVYVFKKNQFWGRILGTFFCGFAIAIYILVVIFKKARPTVKLAYWKYALKISLPIVPHGLSQLILSQFDRVMINKMIGNYEAGMYSFAYNVGSIFNVIIASLDTVWTQFFFDKMEEKQYKDIRNGSKYYLFGVSMGTVVLMLIAPELILILGGEKYIECRSMAIIVLLSMYYYFLYYFPSSIEYYYKKTNYIACGTIIAAILNIILNFIFINMFGYKAAAYTTVFCYFCYYIIHFFFGKTYLQKTNIRLEISNRYVVFNFGICIWNNIIS